MDNNLIIIRSMRIFKDGTNELLGYRYFANLPMTHAYAVAHGGVDEVTLARLDSARPISFGQFKSGFKAALCFRFVLQLEEGLGRIEARYNPNKNMWVTQDESNDIISYEKPSDLRLFAMCVNVNNKKYKSTNKKGR